MYITLQIRHLDSKLLDSENLAHPGVGPIGINSNEPIVRHAYYQWVPFVLFAQALMFYMPHLIWKAFEGNKKTIYYLFFSHSH